MGFALIGCPSRPHKRRRVPQHVQNDYVRAYCQARKIKVRRTGIAKDKVQSMGGTDISNASNNKCDWDPAPIRGTTKSQRYSVHIPRPKSLEDLPVEVIRKIFTLGGAPGQMALLNSFFHRCLRPDKMLLMDVLWEKYLFSPGCVVPHGNRHRFVVGKVHLVSQGLFSDGLLADFFVRYHSELIDQIDYFIGDSILEKLEDQFLQSKDEKDFNLNFDKFIDNLKDREAITDFPAFFYKNFEIYFRYPDFLGKMNKFFTFQNVSSLISDLLRWFLLERDNSYSLSELYSVIDTACTVSTDTTKQPHLESSDPLCTILQILYCDNHQRQTTATGESWERTLREALNLEMESDAIRLEFIRQFLNRYYHPDRNKNARELLSDHMLWRLLKSISRVELIDLIEESGGVPQYGVII